MPTVTVTALTVDHALDLMRACMDNGNVKPGSHFFKELRNEGLIWPDAWHVLQTGRIFDPPEPDIKTGEWKYRIEGHEPDGKWLGIIFCFKAVDEAFLITVFSVEAKRRPS